MQQENKGKQGPQPQQKSLLEQTLQEIENRVIFFSSHNISAQNSLHPSQNISIRSISEIITPLKYFDIAETPLSMGLSMVYGNEVNKCALKWNIPPASQGEDSINEEETFEPSFKWLASAFVDPNLLQVDQPEPTRVEKNKIPEDWVPINSILLTKISKKIYHKTEIQDIQNSIKKKFCERYWWLKFKRVKQVYYKGKPSVLLKFGDANSVAFMYYHYASFKANRQEFGQHCEVLRVLKDDTREYAKQKNWILLIFRHLPLAMTKQQLMAIINDNGCVKWVQDLVEIEGAKYTFCKVTYLDDALHVCELFNSKKIKDAKVNIHPKNSKNWKAEQVMQEQQHIQESVNIKAENQNILDIDKSY